MDIRLLAVMLLIGRLTSLFFVVGVIRLQIKLMRAKAFPELRPLRRILFAMSIVFMTGTIIPIIIDVLTLLPIETGRATAPSAIGVAYVLSNNFAALISSMLLWGIYKVTEPKESEFYESRKIKGEQEGN
jgi:hypothetical protein